MQSSSQLYRNDIQPSIGIGVGIVQDYDFKDTRRRHQKTYSQIASNIGPHLPSQLLMHILDESITHLNLHANKIESLHIMQLLPTVKPSANTNVTTKALTLDSLVSIDLSSNHLGSKYDQLTPHSQHVSYNPQNSYSHCLPSSSSQSPPAHSLPSPSQPASSLLLLHIVPNLQILNLSANNLVVESLERLGFSACNSKKTIMIANLKSLNLSYNNISMIPFNIAVCCPLLEDLNIANNTIQDLANLNQLSNMSRLQSFNIKSNPICQKDQSFREKIITKVPTLINFDGVDILEEERRHVKIVANDDAYCWNMHKNALLVAGNEEESSSLHTNINLRHTKRNNTPRCPPAQRNSKTKNNDRMKNTVETLSLSKLNKLEFEIKNLSKLAAAQVQATRQLQNSTSQDHDTLQMMNSTKETNESCEFQKSFSLETNMEQSEKVQFVCDAAIQTNSFEYQHSNAPVRDTNKSPFTNRYTLALGLYKWRMVALQQKLRIMVIKEKDESGNKIKEYLHKMMKQQNEYPNESKQTASDRNEKSQLREECVAMKNKLNQKEFELSNLKESHKAEMNRIQSEMRLEETERIQASLLKQLKWKKKANHLKIIESKLTEENKELKHSLRLQTQKVERFEKKLERVYEEMQSYKKVNNFLTTEKVSVLFIFSHGK